MINRFSKNFNHKNNTRFGFRYSKKYFFFKFDINSENQKIN
jgi:hypothetical protein